MNCRRVLDVISLAVFFVLCQSLAVTQATPPSAPSGLTASTVSSNRINLSWTDNSTNEMGYRIERAVLSGGPWSQIGATGVNATSYSDSSCRISTIYFYRVRAINATGNSGYSNIASAATLAATLNAPSGLAANAVSSSQISLSWTDNSTNETGFTIERATASSGPWSQIVTGANVTSYSNSGLSASTTYHYRVRAMNTAGSSAYSNSVSVTTTQSGADTASPSVPTGPAATSDLCTSISLSWNPSADTGGSGLLAYNVYRGGAFLEQILASDTSYSDAGLAPSTSYSYRVAAVDNAGNVSAQSAIASTSTPACDGGFMWDTSLGGTSADLSEAVATDANGNTLVTGYMQGTVDFGGGQLTSAGGQDVFIAKFSPELMYRWARRFGGASGERGQGIAVDSVGDVIVTGYFQGTVDFGGGPLASAGGTDIFVAKYSGVNGAHLWSKRLGGTGSDSGAAIAVDAGGNVVVTGSFKWTVDFGGGPLTSALYGADDTFVAKYTAAGAHVWSKNFPSNSNDFGKAVAVDASGNVVVTGYFWGTVNLGGANLTTTGNLGEYDLFVGKFSAAGAHVWSKNFGSDAPDYGDDVAFDRDGNVILTGRFQTGANFGNGPLTSAGDFDVFVAKLSGPTGAHLWSRGMGGSSTDGPSDVAVDVSGNVVLTGRFKNAANFGGSSLTSAGDYDVFVAKYSGVNGTHVWSQAAGSTAADGSADVASDATGHIVLTGYFQEAVDFGGGPLTSLGSYELFLLYLYP